MLQRTLPLLIPTGSWLNLLGLPCLVVLHYLEPTSLGHFWLGLGNCLAMRFTLLGCFFLVVSENAPFITTWRTNSTNENITFPLATVSSLLTVDWGDGAKVNFSALPVTHKYAVAGDYNVSVVGNITGFSFSNAGDKLKLK